MVWRQDSRGRVAKSLLTLIDQVDATWPNRKKTSDGTIASSQHSSQNPTSDHEIKNGIVRALDITNDPAHGVNARAIAQALLDSRDPRISYVISNRQMARSYPKTGTTPWQWSPYTQSNPHTEHCHVSVVDNPTLYDDPRPWAIKAGQIPQPPLPRPPVESGVTADMRRRMMEEILKYEGRFDGGDLKVFIAPDGRPEIGGITQKDHPEVYAQLKRLLDLGQQARLKDEVLKYYDQYTSAAKDWTNRAGLEFFLRDCILNRGPSGAAEILQMALGVAIDHQVGPATRNALAALDENVAIDKLRIAREKYEDKKYGKANRVAKGQWQGLVNRWNKAQAQAHKFSAENPVKSPAIKTAPATKIGVGGGAAAAAGYAAHWLGAHWMLTVGVVLVVVAMAIYFMRDKEGPK